MTAVREPASDEAKSAAREEALPRKYWLKRRRLIRPLFNKGRDDVFTCAAGSIRILARAVSREETGENVPFQVGFSAGGRVTNAVERNYIRRLLRETFRRHPSARDLFEDRRDTLAIMILFRSHSEGAHKAIPRDLPQALDQLLDFKMPIEQARERHPEQM